MQMHVLFILVYSWISEVLKSARNIGSSKMCTKHDNKHIFIFIRIVIAEIFLSLSI